MRDPLGNVVKLHGLAQRLAGRGGKLLAGAEHGPGQHHHLAAVAVVEAMRTLAGKDVGSNERDILTALERQ